MTNKKELNFGDKYILKPECDAGMIKDIFQKQC